MNPLHRYATAPALCLAALAAGGCATVIHGREQQIPVSSTPSQASVSVDGVDTCRTPCTVRVTRHDNHTVRVALPGYEAAGITVRRDLSPWLWANLANGALPGITIDALTGGLYELAPARVELALRPAEPR